MGGTDSAECEWGELLMSNYLVTDSDLTSVANAIRTKGGTSAQLAFPSGFVSAIGDISAGGGGNVNITQDANGSLVIGKDAPSGGGGITRVANGTFTGDDSYVITFPIGYKMAQTDFLLKIKIQSGQEMEYNSSYKFTVGAVAVFSDVATFDLSTTGPKNPTSQISVNENNGGTITSRAVGNAITGNTNLRNGSVNENAFGTFQISRHQTNGFSIIVGQSNASYKWPNGIKYDYDILYFGSNPSTDIIDIST